MCAARKKTVPKKPVQRAANSAAQDLSSDFEQILSEDLAAECERAVELALEVRRPQLLQSLIARLQESSIAQPETSDEEDDRAWVPVESLSALRGLVGGRFHNLKKRWVDAGLPLREHRGDKGGSVEIEQEGWVELTNWIMKQGFEVRRDPEDERCLFELRAVES